MLICGVLVRPRHALLALAAALVGLGVGVSGCYRGFDVDDKQPPPGYAGGQCLPAGCYEPAACLDGENICLDTLDPCKGVYCGGYGTCGIDLDTNIPFCACDPGYTNEPYAYFCVPMGL